MSLPEPRGDLDADVAAEPCAVVGTAERTGLGGHLPANETWCLVECSRPNAHVSCRVMMGHVFAVSSHLQILDPVVEFVAVDVMDDLVAIQFPAEVDLNNVSVFRRRLPVDGDPPVSLVVDVAILAVQPDAGVAVSAESMRMPLTEAIEKPPAIAPINGASEILPRAIDECYKRVTVAFPARVVHSTQPSCQCRKAADGARRPLSRHAEHCSAFDYTTV